MAPINLPDGSQVSEIVLPDGSTASKVLAPDGSTVFSAIPDSVVNRWPIDEGSGTTFNDVEGASDASTFGGITWESDATSIGGERVLLDGTDDGANSGAAKPAGSFTFLITIETTEDITKIAEMQAVLDGSGASGVAGEAELRFRGDQSTNRIELAVPNDSDNNQLVNVDNAVSSNTKHRVAGILDTSASEIKIAVDGSVVATNTVSGNFQTQLSNHSIGADGYGNQRYLPGYVDDSIIANEAYSSDQLSDDYNRQPWS